MYNGSLRRGGVAQNRPFWFSFYLGEFLRLILEFCLVPDSQDLVVFRNVFDSQCIERSFQLRLKVEKRMFRDTYVKFCYTRGIVLQRFIHLVKCNDTHFILSTFFTFWRKIALYRMILMLAGNSF